MPVTHLNTKHTYSFPRFLKILTQLLKLIRSELVVGYKNF